MHRLSATPGGWTPDQDGVVFIDQTPAPIVFLTSADTDIQTLASAVQGLPDGFPALRVANLLSLQQELTIDTYLEDVVRHARVVVLRLLGGRAYWSYGLEVVKQTVQHTGASLLVLPGDDRPDPDLTSHSTVALSVVNTLWQYLTEGGIENMTHALQWVANACLGTKYATHPPQSVPRVGVYRWQKSGLRHAGATANPLSDRPLRSATTQSRVGVLFYRSHYLSGNTAPIDALCDALHRRGLEPVPMFVSSLRDRDAQDDILTAWRSEQGASIQVLLNTTSFSLAKLNSETVNVEFWQTLNVPVIQVILSSGTHDQWLNQWQGLAPRDIAMNVALPEVDGRIISRAVSFKTVQVRNAALETDVVVYEPVGDRIQFVADLACRWARLAQTPPSEKRIALILANYPTRDGRLANGVGLDTPASCVEILNALQKAGYQVNNIPDSGDALIHQLTQAITNDPEAQNLRPVHQFLSGDDYWRYFQTLPDAVQRGIGDRWNTETSTHGMNDSCLSNHSLHPPFPIPGLQFGNVFVGIQPSRGYDRDPALNYHSPDLEPTHEYLAFYCWLRDRFDAHAIVHVGKHGNLEWLPGKGIALSQSCYPEVALGAMPHFYPFIVNDPGEGAQAKRRAQAVILDHLTPPMTRAELYGPLQQLEHLIDEYYEAQNLDPTRLPMIRDRILKRVLQENLYHDLENRAPQSDTDPFVDVQTREPSIPAFQPSSSNFTQLLTLADGYLCELKEAQIRDGLHILGQCPSGRQLRDLIVAIARHPSNGRKGLTCAIADDWHLGINPLTDDPAQPLMGEIGRKGRSPDIPINLDTCRTVGDLVEVLEDYAAALIDRILIDGTWQKDSPVPKDGSFNDVHTDACLGSLYSNDSFWGIGAATEHELHWIDTFLLPALQRTSQEITHLLSGLDGGYVPSGASGAPTRGRSDVLPTGRNFYSVDIRSIPTESAWDVGRRAADALIERYTQEHGDYPKTLGLSVWGTSTMRTGGDDIAEALALLGVRPVWDGLSRRVIDFEILPVSVLGRPRVDVTLRISGFFRDAFSHLISLVHQAVEAVAALDEPADQNPLATHVNRDGQRLHTAGLPLEQAMRQARYRVFGSKPGAYGAGLQGLIESQNWSDDGDLARAYINWSSYAYTGEQDGRAAPDAFQRRLDELQIVLHNQDNREHDLLDSDDYYQFQGGMTAAARVLQGKNPATYFGDHSLPARPRIRQLREEIARVYRSRVVNPKWIAGIMRHGYKGAFELSATVDYLFAYDATANCVEDHMYQGIAQTYVLDSSVQAFVREKNPWALRDMAERLLEAHQRGLWNVVETSTLDQLRAIAHEAEARIENHLSS
ncbi:MAG: cobaltochelatase subunit CobN [Elainellaceae cyanobacterium]